MEFSNPQPEGAEAQSGGNDECFADRQLDSSMKNQNESDPRRRRRHATAAKNRRLLLAALRVWELKQRGNGR